MGEIFISHAVADKPLIDAFVDFLQTGCGVRHENVFCTSLEGMNVTEGSDFVDIITKNLKDASFVVMVITPSYYESVFCLCELGATWIMQHDAFPLLVPPLTFADLKAVLTPLQAGVINNPESLANLWDRLKKIGIASGATSRFGLKRDAFIAKLAKIPVKGRTHVPAAEHQVLKDQYEAALKATLEAEDERDRVKAEFNELAKTKDKADVRRIKLAGSNDRDKFQHLAEEFNGFARRLPRAAREALFHLQKGDTYVLPDYYVNKEAHEDASDAEQRQFVTLDGNSVRINALHPQVHKAIASLGELEAFMDQASKAFAEEYEESEGHPFSLMNRDLWRSHLGL